MVYMLPQCTLTCSAGAATKSKTEMSFHPSRDDSPPVARPAQNAQYENVTRAATGTKEKTSTPPKLKSQSVGARHNEAFISGPKDDRPVLTEEMILKARTVAEVAAVLHIEKKTLQNRISADKLSPSPNPKFPKYFTLGQDGEKLFPREWTLEWLQRNIQISGFQTKAKF